MTPAQKIVANAIEQTRVTRIYDPAYVPLGYPLGDVPKERGVCADVIIRAFRAAGIDLQQEVHEDIKRSPRTYPNLWNQRAPDPSIDHRRVANLMAWFRRRGHSLPVTTDAADYRPGDVVAWKLPGGRLHIGIVTDRLAPRTNRPLIVHNIATGANLEDVLFTWKIFAHYRPSPHLLTSSSISCSESRIHPPPY
jgi:uncharacterized protein YijF (DUF1287 family)